MRILFTLVLALLCGTAQSAFFNNDFTTNAFHSATPVVVLDNSGIPLGLGTTSTNAFLMRRSTGFTFVDAGTNGMVGGGPFTVNTLPKATATNALGDSSITDAGGIISSTNNTLLLGSTSTQDTVTIQANAVTDIGGSSVLIVRGGTSPTDGGSIAFVAGDAAGIDKSGGSLTFNSGAGTGTGANGDVNFNALNLFTVTSGNDASFDSPSVRPASSNLVSLGTAAKPWGSNYIGTKLFIGTNQYTDNGTSLLRNGSAVGGGAAGITNSGLTLNTVVKATGTNSVGNSSFTDNGTVVTFTEPLLFSTDNTLDIGATNATRPRDIYVGRQVLAAQGTNTQPSLSFATATNMGIYVQGTGLGLSSGSGGSVAMRTPAALDIGLFTTSVFRQRSDTFLSWYSSTTPVIGGGSDDTLISREAAAIFQLGADAATPVVQTLKGPDGSGTDKPATNFTVAPGRGTGTGGGGTFYIATAGPGAASASTQNVLTNRLSVDNQGSVAISNFNGTATALVGSSASNTLSTVTLGTGLSFSAGTLNASGTDTTATNVVTLTMTGTNVSAMDYSLVQRGGVFKLVLTGTAFIGAPSGVANTSFSKATLMVQQPSTGTCALTFTNGFYAFPEGVAPIIDTNNGAVTVFEFKSDVFTNGLLHGWMSLKSKLIP